jgi:hypothetical protein
MVSRREALAAFGTAALGSTAGCLDGVPFLGGDALEFEAAPCTIPQSVLESTGYRETDRRDMTVERTFEAAGQSQDVVVTNRLAEYDKGLDLGAANVPASGEFRAAIVTALTTPQVDVLGQTFNPVAEMDSAELAGIVQDRYEGIDNLQQTGERTAPVAGESTTVGTFEAEADLVDAGVTVDLTLHIGEAVEAGDDLIVAVGGYPSALAEQERQHVFAMFDGIEHEG